MNSLIFLFRPGRTPSRPERDHTAKPGRRKAANRPSRCGPPTTTDGGASGKRVQASATSATRSCWRPRATQACSTWNNRGPCHLVRHRRVPRGTSVTRRACPSIFAANGPRWVLSFTPRFDAPNPLSRHAGLDANNRGPAIPSTPTKVFAPGFTECHRDMAAKARAAAARLGGQARYWGDGGGDNLGTRILDQLTAKGVDVAAVRRIAGCVSPSAAILVAAQGERLVCACNDPRLDADASWRPLERDADCHGVLGDVRRPEGTAAVFDAAARHGILRVFDGAVGPRETLVDLANRATPAALSQPRLAHASGTSAPGGLMRSRAPSQASSASP